MAAATVAGQGPVAAVDTKVEVKKTEEKAFFSNVGDSLTSRTAMIAYAVLAALFLVFSGAGVAALAGLGTAGILSAWGVSFLGTVSFGASPLYVGYTIVALSALGVAAAGYKAWNAGTSTVKTEEKTTVEKKAETTATEKPADVKV